MGQVCHSGSLIDVYNIYICVCVSIFGVDPATLGRCLTIVVVLGSFNSRSKCPSTCHTELSGCETVFELLVSGREVKGERGDFQSFRSNRNVRLFRLKKNEEKWCTPFSKK